MVRDIVKSGLVDEFGKPLRNQATEVSPQRDSKYSNTGSSLKGFLRSEYLDCLNSCDIDQPVNVKSVMGIAAAYRCIDLLTTFAETTPMRLWEEEEATGDAKRAVDHPGYSLMRFQANDAVKAGTLRGTLLYHALTNTCGIAEIIREGNELREDFGAPLAIVPLDPDEIAWGVLNDELIYFKRDKETPDDPNWNWVPIPPKNIFHIKGVSHDAIDGIDRVKVLKEEWGLILARRTHARKFFASGGAVNGFFMLPAEADPEDWSNFFEQTSEQVAELKNLGFRVAPLFNGIQFQPITRNAEEAQLVESMEMTPRTIATIYGVPPHLLGDTTRTSLRSLEEENKSLLQFSVDPWFTRFEEEANCKLLKEGEWKSELLYFQFDRDRFLLGDQKTVNEVIIQKYHGGLLGWKEARKELKLSTDPKDDHFVLPQNIVGANPQDPRTADESQPSDAIPPKGEGSEAKAAVSACESVKSVIEMNADWMVRLIANSALNQAKPPKSLVQFESWFDKKFEFDDKINTMIKLSQDVGCECEQFDLVASAMAIVREEWERPIKDNFYQRLEGRVSDIHALKDQMTKAITGV